MNMRRSQHREGDARYGAPIQPVKVGAVTDRARADASPAACGAGDRNRAANPVPRPATRAIGEALTSAWLDDIA